LTEVAQGLKEQLQSKSIKQVDTLQIIKDALVKEDRRSAQNQAKVDQRGKEPPKQRPPLNFNKEENEEIMEGLMNRIVSKPAFGEDPKTAAKIDKLLKVKIFQRMVE